MWAIGDRDKDDGIGIGSAEDGGPFSSCVMGPKKEPSGFYIALGVQPGGWSGTELMAARIFLVALPIGFSGEILPVQAKIAAQILIRGRG